MAGPRAIPMLPCADIDEIASFFGPLGFRVTYRQRRPNLYLALAGHGFDLHYYGLDGHDPAASHSTCGILVDDTGPIWEAFAEALRTSYGGLPVVGFPRITRPRPRRNAGGLTGFSLVDPAGNWIRFMRGGEPDQSSPAISALGEALQNAIVLADSKGDVAPGGQDPARCPPPGLARRPVDRGSPGVPRRAQPAAASGPLTALGDPSAPATPRAIRAGVAPAAGFPRGLPLGRRVETSWAGASARTGTCSGSRQAWTPPFWANAAQAPPQPSLRPPRGAER